MTTPYPTKTEALRPAITERAAYRTNARQAICRGTLWTGRQYCSTLKPGEGIVHPGVGRVMCAQHYHERNYIEANIPRWRTARRAIRTWLNEHARMEWQSFHEIERLISQADPFGHVVAEGILAALENLALPTDELLEYGEIYDLARAAAQAALETVEEIDAPAWLDDPEEYALRNQELRRETIQLIEEN